MHDRIVNNLGYWLRPASSCRPDAIALIDLCGPRPVQLTYAALEDRMDRFAALLSGSGLVPGDRLAMVVGNRHEFVDIMFGAMRAGIVPVPINTKLGADALDYIIRDARCLAAVVDPSCAPHALPVLSGCDLAHRWAFQPVPPDWQDYHAATAATPAHFDPPPIPGDHPAFQPYTSGSTGRPKGVILTHAGQLWWIRTTQKYWPADTAARALVAVPLYHKNAMAGAIKPMLYAGGSVVLLPDFEPRRFLTVLSEYRCTQAGAVPAVFTKLLQHRDLIDRLDFTALKSLKLGSAPVQEELMRAVETAFGVKVGESYGLTEGGPVMIGPPVDGRVVPIGSCGVAWPEGEVKLVRDDGTADSRFGELWVRNPGVTPGYHNLPDVNARRLKDGWLATGDLFEVDDDGFFYFRGRTDDMFNCGGENIYPKEVEDLLLRHPAVYDASVVPLPHPVKGMVPVALVMARHGDGVTEAALKAHCLAKGPAYAHPRRILVVDALPLNGAGKVDRGEVAKRLHDAFGGDLAQAH